MRQYDSLKKFFVLGTMVLMLAGIFPIDSLTGNEKVSVSIQYQTKRKALKTKGERYGRISLMWIDKIIKQNSPYNILWRLFRIEVERQELPTEMSRRICQLLQDVEKKNRFQSSERRGENNEE